MTSKCASSDDLLGEDLLHVGLFVGRHKKPACLNGLASDVVLDEFAVEVRDDLCSIDGRIGVESSFYIY